jgi:hypothetical protein
MKHASEASGAVLGAAAQAAAQLVAKRSVAETAFLTGRFEEELRY